MLAKVTSHAEPLAVCVTELRAVSARPAQGLPWASSGLTICERVGEAGAVMIVLIL